MGLFVGLFPFFFPMHFSGFSLFFFALMMIELYENLPSVYFVKTFLL